MFLSTKSFTGEIYYSYIIEKYEEKHFKRRKQAYEFKHPPGSNENLLRNILQLTFVRYLEDFAQENFSFNYKLKNNF